MRSRALLVVLAGATLATACDLPPLSVRFSITSDRSEQCTGDTGNTATSCEDITMLCDAVISIRVVPPSDPSVPYITVCRPLTGAQNKLCAIAGVDLPQPTVDIPEQTLEVQMAVFPKSAVPTDPDTGELLCPRVEFAADGLPVTALPVCTNMDPMSCPRVPAVGGRAFYHPGDSQTVVDLGCSDLGQLQSQCEGMSHIDVTATVNDFDDLVSSVDKTLGDRLTVSVGEPEPLTPTYVLKPGDTHELLRSSESPPAWSVQLTNIMFTSYECLQVLEDGAQTTSTLTCRAADGKTMIDMAGVYLSKASLNQILMALGKTAFPDEGMVIGMVVDEFYNPLANVAVSCGGCSIQYLNDTRTGTVSGATSKSGVFVSTGSSAAPFGTGFTIPSTMLRPVLGGLVEGKITVVVIQDKIPIGP